MFCRKKAILQLIIIILKQGLKTSFYSKPIWSELHKIIRRTRLLGRAYVFCFLKNLTLYKCVLEGSNEEEKGWILEGKGGVNV